MGKDEHAFFYPNLGESTRSLDDISVTGLRQIFSRAKKEGVGKTLSRLTLFVFNLLIFHLLYLVIPLAALAIPVFTFWNDTQRETKIFVGCLVAAYILTFNGQHKKLDSPKPWFADLPVWGYLLSYLPLRICRTTKLSPDKHYIFGCHPHGAFAFNRGAVGFCMPQLFNAAFPGMKVRCLAADAAFYVPFIREMWIWSCCVSASKKTAIEVLKNGMSCFIYPGGEKEQLMHRHNKERLFLNSRKGFIKLALQTGSQLVPVYAFGESSLYKQTSILHNFRMMLSKKFGVAIPLVYGHVGLLPFRHPVTVTFGKAIDVKKNENPTQGDIDELHQAYITALTKLFDEEKERMGYGDRELEIF